jgi:hypothetical protein
VFVGTFGSLISACSSQLPPATEAEKRAASDAFFECLHANVQTMDDGISPAKGVGAAADQACITKCVDSENVYTRGMNNAAKLDFIERLDAQTPIIGPRSCSLSAANARRNKGGFGCFRAASPLAACVRFMCL